MSLKTAQWSAWMLARSLMVSVILFRSGAAYGVMPLNEFDGDPELIVRDYDPWEIM